MRNTDDSAPEIFKNSNKATSYIIHCTFLSMFTLLSTVIAAMVNLLTDGLFTSYVFLVLSTTAIINSLIMLVVDPIVILRNEDAKSALSKLKSTAEEWLQAMMPRFKSSEEVQAATEQ